MYEYTTRPQHNAVGMGHVLHFVAPAAAVAAGGIALARRAQQQREQEFETEMHEMCADYQGGRPCSPQQLYDICYNMHPDVWTSFCTRILPLEYQCRQSEGRDCSPTQLAMYCTDLFENERPQGCTQALAAVRFGEAQRSEIEWGEAQRVSEPTLLLSEAQRIPPWEEVAYAKGMQGLGWTRVPERPGCSEVPGGEQICFRTTEVEGSPPEQDFARERGCAPMSLACETSPYGNPGLTWCCPSGWETYTQETTEAVFRNPWFYAGLVGTGLALYFGWKIFAGRGE